MNQYSHKSESRVSNGDMNTPGVLTGWKNRNKNKEEQLEMHLFDVKESFNNTVLVTVSNVNTNH